MSHALLPALALLALTPGPAELERQGAAIGEVFIYPGDIFDLEDPRENTALYRLANRLHINTQPHVIEKQLLFKPADRYSQRLLDESARILRSARYLYDASVEPIPRADGRVDVAVRTRDVWTLNPGLSFSRRGGKNSAGFELEELNLLGTGTDLSIARKSGVDRDSTLIEYADRHVLDSWVQVYAAYSSNSDGSSRALAVERPFYSLDTRWAAQLSLADEERIEPLYDLGRIVDEFGLQRKFTSLSWGVSRGLKDGWARRFSIGATYDENVFTTITDTRSASLVPDDRKLVYPWLGFEWVQDDYERFRNHDQIGRTEDLHLGARLYAQIGYADGSFGADRSAVILAGKASRGFAAAAKSAVLLSSEFAGRFEGGELRNGLLEGSARFYSKQSDRRLFFAAVAAAVGRALDGDEQILLGGDNGLRGYPLRYQGGNARALLTVEQRYFTNWHPFRLFRVGGAAFVDVGRTWGEGPASTPSQGLLKNVGIGLRLANSRSGLGNIIHVDLAFPLDGDASSDSVQFLVETKERF